MKHKLLIILLFIFSIGSFIFVNYKINSLDYKENVEDKDLYILMNGTKEIIYDLLDEEKLVWGKSNDTKKRYDKIINNLCFIFNSSYSYKYYIKNKSFFKLLF
ncbi:MAG: hypothetical protein II309_07705 [Bacilli bacterium]|nr:hypothetical protein [Bacilli bacterium]